MPQPPSRYTCFNLPASLVPRLHTLKGEESLAATLVALAHLAALHPLRHARSYETVTGPRMKYQFVDKPTSRVLPILKAHGFSLSTLMKDLVLDPATPARLTYWRSLTSTERREDFRRAAARAGLATPVLVEATA